jgi:hypothetical protein
MQTNKKKPIIIKKIKKKPIIGYEGLYEIYEDGQVYSKYSNRFLKSHQKSGQEYLIVHLYKNGKRKHFNIHRLIAIHFIPNPYNKPQVDHIDRNRLNNSIKNLRWCTHQQNNCNTSIKSNKKNGAKYVGVDWKESRNKWRAYVKINGKYIHIGYYDDEEEAYEERKKYILKNHPDLYNYFYS